MTSRFPLVVTRRGSQIGLGVVVQSREMLEQFFAGYLLLSDARPSRERAACRGKALALQILMHGSVEVPETGAIFDDTAKGPRDAG